ncbi:MAG: flagellar motor switch protein FliN, partial [Phycisphaerales bacterium]|nr:flagellar motor switch protein FliN [Phycisphaerales bacterium]
AGGAAGGEASAAAPMSLPSFESFASAGSAGASPENLELLSDVHLHVKIELGRTRMLIEDVLKLAEGAVVELDKLAGDPVDIYVNGRPVARGEVLVLNDNFCVRINEILPVGGGEAA